MAPARRGTCPAGRLVLNLQPAAELRRVDDAGDVGPAGHQQPGHLGVPPLRVRLGSRRGNRSRSRSRPSAARLDPTPQERAVGEELVRQVAGQQLVVATGGPKTAPVITPMITSDFNSILALIKLRLAPYISSGMNDCAVCDKGSPQTVHMHKMLIIT